ncbi:DDB1- and CUL4-associated factor 12 homolog isoform X1 [Tachypleus tridentatus]|uniref:DDB1- and CUL4-associated factor 12 homolog isoform X1 n=1 Tax=Tachypleus tridentatus TaxID=6853 RepID=UPI003FD2723D
MASVRKIPITSGKSKPSAVALRQSFQIKSELEQYNFKARICLGLADEDYEEHLPEELYPRRFSVNVDACISRNFVDYINTCQIGNQKLQNSRVAREYGIQHLVTRNLMIEKSFSLGELNKVFCSQWLNDQQVAFGTKCNKFVVQDVASGRRFQIPSLKSSSHSKPPENPCGIHAMEINPSQTMLVTGAKNSNDVAVYRLPTLDPLCVGEGAHYDWIFDIKWLDDQFFVSGSRDTKLALWRVKDNEIYQNNEENLPKYHIIHPLTIKTCKSADKVRALLFNDICHELVALSLNGYLHLWDVGTFRQKTSRKLGFCQENVCLAQQQERGIYVVGSRAHTLIFDNRTLRLIKSIPSSQERVSIRSLSFRGDLLTIGTGIGEIHFYDFRASDYLKQVDSNRQAFLCASKSWVYPDELIFQEYLMNWEHNTAIYTHCYDTSGTRLFAAGGPLPASLQGSYAGIWQ